MFFIVPPYFMHFPLSGRGMSGLEDPVGDGPDIGRVAEERNDAESVLRQQVISRGSGRDDKGEKISGDGRNDFRWLEEEFFEDLGNPENGESKRPTQNNRYNIGIDHDTTSKNSEDKNDVAFFNLQG